MTSSRGPVKKSPGKMAAPADKSKKGRGRLLAAIGLVILVIVWYAWPNSQLDKVRRLQKEIFTTPAGELSSEEKKGKFQALRAEQEKLTPEERQLVRQEKGQEFKKKMNAVGSKYLVMSADERQKFIDERLARDQKRAQDGGPPPPPGGFGGPGGPPDQGAPRTPPTAEDRDTKRREALLQMTPTARAGMDQMRMDMAQRRAQFGLPPSSGRGPKGP